MKTLGILIAGLALSVLALIVGGIWTMIAWENTHASQTCTVQQKDRTSTSDGGSDVRIYTSNCGVLTIADDMLQGRYNSADVYSMIEPGKTYTFKTVGWRNGFFSQFPNIVDVKAH
jgi:hypothetical protein